MIFSSWYPAGTYFSFVHRKKGKVTTLGHFKCNHCYDHGIRVRRPDSDPTQELSGYYRAENIHTLLYRKCPQCGALPRIPVIEMPPAEVQAWLNERGSA
jgi:hypothetical protein